MLKHDVHLLLHCDLFSHTNICYRALSLKGNELGPEGVASIADAMNVNTTLTSINLADTGMGNDPISRDAMRVCLVRHPTLTELDLNLNAIGAEGGQMLLEVLAVNSNIVKCGVFERLGQVQRGLLLSIEM